MYVTLTLHRKKICPWFRGRGGGQNDGAEDEGGGGEETNKRNRREDVTGGNQRAGCKEIDTNCSNVSPNILSL